MPNYCICLCKTFTKYITRANQRKSDCEYKGKIYWRKCYVNFWHKHYRDNFFSSAYTSVVDKRCIFYEKLVSRKFIKPCYQTALRRELNVEQKQWKHIYQCKLCDMPYKRLSEFNYKFFNNILCNKAFLSKYTQIHRVNVTYIW